MVIFTVKVSVFDAAIGTGRHESLRRVTCRSGSPSEIDLGLNRLLSFKQAFNQHFPEARMTLQIVDIDVMDILDGCNGNALDELGLPSVYHLPRTAEEVRDAAP